EKYATPINPFVISKLQQQEAEAILTGKTYEEDFVILKNTLKNLGFSIPVLYRRYTELCNYGGAKFVSFSVDEGFMNAIDGLILLDLHDLRPEYKERYYFQKSFVN
ncbi:MAG TPA: GNAT family N-acetyltransferase, partial [Candidatus Kapabacteria bacterium]|nr:GNAT family N-acetyltransferase [Candidatus Kapabacteria bacterium]